MTEASDVGMIAPFVCGYDSGMTLPRQQISEAPASDESDISYVKFEILERQVEIYVCENGEIFFDFFRSVDAPAVIGSLSTRHSDQAKIAAMRIRIVNFHRMCLRSAAYHRHKGFSKLDRHITSTTDLSWDWQLQCYESKSADPSATLDDVVAGTELFDELWADNSQNYLEIFNAFDLSNVLINMFRFGESISLCWNICEKVLERFWRSHINLVGATKQLRKRKGEGRLETLQRQGIVSDAMVRELHSVRASRNSWIHNFKEPRAVDALEALRITEALLSFVAKRKLHLRVPFSELSTGAMGIRKFKELHPDPHYPLGIDWRREPDVPAAYEIHGPSVSAYI